jgi:copper chaperone CopZ
MSVLGASGFATLIPVELPKNSTMTANTYSVPDISCSHCAGAITSALELVAGVEAVDIDLEAKTVTVTGRSPAEDAIVGAIEQAGYEVVAGR